MEQPTRPDSSPTRTGMAVTPAPDATRTARPGVGDRLAALAESADKPAASTYDRGQTPTPLDAPLVADHVIEGPIGRGGMGCVYRAFAVHLNQHVALKVMDVRGGLAERRRFEQEARILSRLHHRNVIPVRSGGHTTDGRPYYTMKLVTSGTLLSRSPDLRADGRAAVRTLSRIARAVQYLHDHGVWHRDLKPTNVLVDDDGEPLVADFGVSKLADEDRTVGSPRVGTYSYMAPEVTADGSRKSGPAADVWSLGVIAYELLGGRRPFATPDPDADLTELIRTHIPAPLVGSPDAAAGVDPALEGVVRRCLAKNPTDRPTAGEYADALDCWLAGQPIPPPKKPKSVKRWRWAAAVAVALAGVGISVAGIPKWLRKPATLVERLEKGEVVTVVGPNGELLLPIGTTDPEMPQPVPQSGGGLVLNTANTILAEIWNAPIPFPVKVTAEVEVLNGPERAEAGVYCRRKRYERGAPLGRVDALVSNGYHGVPYPIKNPPATDAVTFAARLHYPDDPADDWATAGSEERRTRRPEAAGQFRLLSLTFSPDDLSAAANGECELTRRHFVPFDRYVRDAFQVMKIESPDAVFGSGFGLYAHNSAARFRNVTVEPVGDAPPAPGVAR
jgi:serine/threonine protein kinase